MDAGRGGLIFALQGGQDNMAYRVFYQQDVCTIFADFLVSVWTFSS